MTRRLKALAMPHEVRYLSFTKREVEMILRAGVPALARAVPAGRLTCFRDLGDHFEFRFERTAVLALTPAECFSCILRHCQAHNIPIGRTMKKRLEGVGDQLVLVLGDIEIAAASEAALRVARAGALCPTCREADQLCRFDVESDEMSTAAS